MRFKDQCPECGEWKWCGYDCEMKPTGHHYVEPKEEVLYRKPKFDRKAYMRERWRVKKNAIPEL